jgi:pheromone shutdown protein TraB
LVLIGVGHVFEIGGSIRQLIHSERPAVVALELDADRYQGLLQREQGHRPSADEVRRTPRVYRGLAKFQEQVADSFGVKPGQEMLVAARSAQEIGAQVALIDRHAQKTVGEALNRMRLSEKLRFGWAALASFLPSRKKANIEMEIHRYQENPEKYLEQLGSEFPTIKRVLIDERNEHMAARLRDLVAQHGTVVAVVGDGHVPGLVRLLADQSPVVHRLSDLRSAAPTSVRWMGGADTSRVGFSFDGQSLESAYGRP